MMVVAFARRKLFRHAVDRGRRRRNDLLDPVLCSGLQHRERAVYENLERQSWFLSALRDPDRSLVEDEVGALGDVVHQVDVAKITDYQLGARIRERG